MTDSKSSRNYILYAIGEIALVVIGILIALQVNNWNQNRKLRIELKSSYQNLLIDLEQEQNTFIRDDSLYQRCRYAAEIIQNILVSETSMAGLDSMRNGQRLLNADLNYFNTAYQAMLNTGLHYKSENKKLDHAISNYYSAVNDIKSLFENMGIANRNVRDQQSLQPLQFILRTPDHVYQSVSQVPKWINDPQSKTYQAAQYYLSFYIRQQGGRSSFIKNLLNQNIALQKLLEKQLETL